MSISPPSPNLEFFKRSFGEHFGENGVESFREDDYNSDLDNCSSDEEERQENATLQRELTATKKKAEGEKPKLQRQWVDPERQVDKDLLAVCQGRVRRRAELIDTIRKAYLTDVVLLKNIILENFNEVQIENIAKQWQSSIPSLDVRQLFWLHAPDETSLAVLPCKTCGGSVELMHHDTPEIERLTKLVSMQENQSHDLKILVATQKAKLETCEFNLQDAVNSHMKEKQVMFGKMKELRAQADAADELSAKSREDMKLMASTYDKLQAATADYHEVVAARKKLEIENINLTSSLSLKTEALVAESNQLSKANEEIMLLKKQAIASQAALVKAKAQIEELNQTVNKVTKVYEQAEARYEKTQGFLDDLKKEYAQLEAAKSSLSIDLNILEETSSREMEQMEARLSSLKSQNRKLSSDLASARDMADLLKTKLEQENPDSLNDVHEEEVFRLQGELTTALEEIEALKEELNNAPVGPVSFSSINSVASTVASRKERVTSVIVGQGQTAASNVKKWAPAAIVTKPTAAEVKEEEAAWDLPRSSTEDEDVPPPPELPTASLNDTPHPERLIRPFFQSFASDENGLVAEGSEGESDSDGGDDIKTDDEVAHSHKPKGAHVPPTPKKGGGGGFGSETSDGHAISPGALPAVAAKSRRRSISFAEQARTDSISEIHEAESVAANPVKYKLVKKKVKKILKVTRVVKVWVKKKKLLMVAQEINAEKLRELDVANQQHDQNAPDTKDVSSDIVDIVEGEGSLNLQDNQQNSTTDRRGDSDVGAEEARLSPESDLHQESFAEESSTTQLSASKVPDIVDEEAVKADKAVGGSPQQEFSPVQGVSPVENGGEEALKSLIETEELRSAHTVQKEITSSNEDEEEYLLTAPPSEDMDEYEEVDREVEEELEEEVEETVKVLAEPDADKGRTDDTDNIEESTDENSLQNTKVKKHKKDKLVIGTTNDNGTINMPTRREYVAVTKNSQVEGGSASKVMIAVPTTGHRNSVRAPVSQPAPAPFTLIRETGLSSDMLDPSSDDDDDEKDVNDEDDVDELTEAAKVWGGVMADLKKCLRQNGNLKGQHAIIKSIVETIGPRLRSLCAQHSKYQIMLWRTLKATKTTCDFVSMVRPTISGLLNALNITAALKKGDIDAIYTSIHQNRDRETKGIKADPAKTVYASRDVLRPWAQGIGVDHETTGALTETSDLSLLGNASVGLDESPLGALPSVSAIEYFSEDPVIREERTQRVISTAESMIVYEKMAMKDINHMLLRYMEQTKFKQIDLLSKITALEETIAENARVEKANKERIAKDNIVEIKDDALQGLLRDKKKLDEVLKALATEKDNSLAVKEELTKVELELMNADRRLLEIPELRKKLAMVNEIQTETQKHLSDKIAELDEAQSTLEEKCVQLDRICDERAAMQQDLSTKLCKIDELEVELAGLQELQKATANGLAEMKKRELARTRKQSTTACQHEPDKSFSVDLGIQTEFIFPPLTLRQRIGTAIPGNSRNRAETAKLQTPMFPAVTVSCSFESVNALSSTSIPRCSTSVSSRRDTSKKRRGGEISAANSFLSMSQSMTSVDSRHRSEAIDVDPELTSLFGGPSIEGRNAYSKTQDNRSPQYIFESSRDHRTARTTGNQHRAIGLSLPLVAPSDGHDDSSTATPGAPLDSDRSLRSHLSIAGDDRFIQPANGGWGSQAMTDCFDADAGLRYSPELDMSGNTSRVSTSTRRDSNHRPHQSNIPPQSPIVKKCTHLMSYTEQLEYNQAMQADAIKPQVNALSPLILMGQPRSHEDLVRQSPSHKNGGRAQTTTGMQSVNGVGILSNSFSNISSNESVFSQGSKESRDSRDTKSRGAKIITGIPGQDPMSVNAYRKFVGTSAANRNNNNF